jgi:pyridoxal phosphate enzyme (YggS family)
MSPEAENLAAILARIAAARKGAVRPAPSTTLIAVTKTHGAERIRPLLEAGHRVFGENRVQEAQGKWPALKSEFPDIELHLIGPLQTNKLRDAIGLFDVIHTLDRPKLADALAAEAARGGTVPDLLIQVNTGEEPQKAGIFPADAPALIAAARDERGLKVKGLMCIPPADVAPAPHFALLAKIAREHGLALLSMGMSADFETAIRFGATHVRVGSALFGARGQ